MPAAPDLLAIMGMPALTPSERKSLLKTRKKTGLYAAQPGSGPAGETCGSCEHKTARGNVAGRYLKCLLTRPQWTKGSATDIKARTPACSKWEKVK